MRRRFLDLILLIGFAVWLGPFLVGAGSLVGSLPSWARLAWWSFGPAVLVVLVARVWSAQAGAGRLVLKHPGERALLVGFAVCCVVAAFLPIVIWNVAALMLLGPVALGSIAWGVYQIRDRTAPFYRQSLVLPLIVVGLCALIWMSQETVGLGHRWFTGRTGPNPQMIEWLRVAVGWLVTALLWGLGLRLWANWSAARCVMWTAGVLVIPAAILLIYRLVLLTNPPLSA